LLQKVPTAITILRLFDDGIGYFKIRVELLPVKRVEMLGRSG
jgi:hypothetical protein